VPLAMMMLRGDETHSFGNHAGTDGPVACDGTHYLRQARRYPVDIK
jgi:hypothetical protein